MRRLVFAALLCTLPSTALAKDLSGRLAIGLDNTIARTPALSIRYGVPLGDPLQQLQLEGDFSTQLTRGADDQEFFIGGRAMYGVAVEDQLNLYLGTGLGGMSTPEGFTFRLQPGFSVDAFLFGLENLGFTAGFGLNIDLGETTGIGTSGAVLGGVHYWF